MESSSVEVNCKEEGESNGEKVNSESKQLSLWGCIICDKEKRNFRLKVLVYLWYVIIWGAIYIVSYPDVDNNIQYATSNPAYANTTFRIILFGDSLMNVPSSFFNLPEKIQHQFPNFNFDIINAGQNNDRIADLQRRMYTDVVDKNPDAVFIYWDSDVSDQLVPTLNEESVIQSYQADCVSVFTTCQNASPNRFVAVAGPGILAEGPIMDTLGPQVYNTYSYKYDSLNQYRTYNKNISETFHIPYIDMRGKIVKFLNHRMSSCKLK